MAAEQKIWTIVDIVKWGTTYFTEKGIDSPRLTIELLLKAVTGLDRVALYLQHDRPLAPPELERLRGFVKRRVQREPLQYILGETEFFGLRFSLNRCVFIPRPETEVIVERVLERQRKRGTGTCRILDIGTGSGCIAIALARQLKQAEILAVDTSTCALEVAEKNAGEHGIAAINFEKCDILQTLPKQTAFDVVVANPPYISKAGMHELQPELLQYEPHQALTDESDGLRFYRRFATVLPALLKNDGYYCFEIGYGMESSVRNLFQEAGYSAESFPDYAGIPRGICGERLSGNDVLTAV